MIMDAKALKEKFDGLYTYAVAGRGSADMRVLGDVMCKMMHEVIDAHPQLAEEYIKRTRTRCLTSGVISLICYDQ